MFKKIESLKTLAPQEEVILDFWEKNKIFKKSITSKKEENTYFFYDGPPFATGTPHYGHILAGTIKDVIPRYYTMQGYRIERRFGWDCHGLPVEFEAEKQLELKGKYDIEKIGINKYNEYCRSIVLKYSKEWEYIVKRMGRWVDLENAYCTMDLNFMESVWWVFSTLWKKKLIYNSGKIVPYSARLATPLSNFEVNLAYKNVEDPSIIVRFELQNMEKNYFLTWTTTPWTLPANLLLTVHPDIQYSYVQFEDSFYYAATSQVQTIFQKNYKIIRTLLGKELENILYEPLFPYFNELKEKGAFKIALGDYVDEDTGTGIVHTAPNFGEDDFYTGQRLGLPLAEILDDNGCFLPSIKSYKNLFFKDADKKIIKDLAEQQSLFKEGTLVHSYPFCWRSDTPLLYRVIPTWYVNVQEIKEQLLKNNDSIRWVPHHIQQGRMGKWLEGAKDWAISRNRFWGTPIPVWICHECNDEICIESVKQLEMLGDVKLSDIHKHFVDEIKISCKKCGGVMTRTPEVLDCWFESGAMPYAQEHYPFENKKKFEAAFPADFISEGIDQTRGWFYTLAVLSTALFEKPAFKNVVVSGLLLAETGKKMSKKDKNYSSPNTMIDSYGADAIRLYLLQSSAIKAEECRFLENEVKDVLRNMLLPTWNVLSFFTTYAEVDNWQYDPKLSPITFSNLLDRWLISTMNVLIREIQEAMSVYNLNKAVEPLFPFINKLTNWYIRRSRRRFWKTEETQDKNEAYYCLYHTLKTLSTIVAPFVPFISESIYQHLRQKEDPLSVHLNSFPQYQEELIDTSLMEEMEMIMDIVSMGHAMRSKAQIKVRQPLPKITLLSDKRELAYRVLKMNHLICEELNIKKIVYFEKEEEFIDFSILPNLPVLGPHYKEKMPLLTSIVKKMNLIQIKSLINNQRVTINFEGQEIELEKKDVIIERKAKENYLLEISTHFSLVLDINIDSSLTNEGNIREIINKIQRMRKESDLQVSERIKLLYNAPEEIVKAVTKFYDYIKQEILADTIMYVEETEKLNYISINGNECFFKIIKIK